MYIQRHLSFTLRHPVSTQYAYNNFFLTHNLHIHVIYVAISQEILIQILLLPVNTFRIMSKRKYESDTWKYGLCTTLYIRTQRINGKVTLTQFCNLTTFIYKVERFYVQSKSNLKISQNY